MIVPNTSRSDTAPAGPICANSVAAIAEPNWTDAIAPTTSTPDGARVSSPGRGGIDGGVARSSHGSRC